MNQYTEKQLFDKLNALTKQSDAFMRIEQQVNGKPFTIFSYRLASHNDFLLDDMATESRGITFGWDEGGKPFVASRPFEKFFNLNETEWTQQNKLSLNSETVSIMDKHDGSMISTVWSDDREVPIVKTKASFHSGQARMAHRFLLRPENAPFAKELAGLTRSGLTIIMEYVGPDNPIVLNYSNEDLIVLAIRNNKTGQYVGINNLQGYDEVKNRAVQEYVGSLHFHSVDSFVKEVPNMKGIEGFVLRLRDGTQVKIKTQEYMTLHHNKSNVYNVNALFDAVMDEQTDDLRVMFRQAGDLDTVGRIDRFEDMVLKNLRSIIHQVDEFHEKFGHLNRKDYANTAKEHFDGGLMFLAMEKYKGNDPDYVRFAKYSDNHKKYLIDQEWQNAPTQFDD